MLVLIKSFFGGKQLPIEEVSQVKYLGVFFDEKFSWKKLIQYIYSKLSSDSRALMKLRNYVYSSLSRLH